MKLWLIRFHCLSVYAAAMAYKTIPAERKVQKFAHMTLNLIAIILGIVGICAVFKFHNMLNSQHMTSLHSWIGMGTICCYCLQVKPSKTKNLLEKFVIWNSYRDPLIRVQWLFGFSVFWLPSASQPTRAGALPWHISGGRAVLYMAICSAVTGLIQKAMIQSLGWSRELRLINFIGVFVILFGITVDFSIALARYVY